MRPGGVPGEAERLELFRRALEKARIRPHLTEGAEREGLEIGLRLQ